MLWKPKSPAIIHAPAEALDEYGNLRIGGGLPSSRRMMMAAAGSGAAFACDSATFDGSTNYMSRDADLTGIADNKEGLLSFWISLNGGNGADQYIISAANVGRLVCRRRGNNTFEVYASNSSSALIIYLTSNSTYTDGSGGLHVLASWNLATPEGYLFINGSDDEKAGATETDDTIDYAGGADWRVGGRGDSGGLIDADLAEFYFTNEFLASAAALSAFREDGKAKSLGADGSLPTGTAPLIYHHLDDGEAVANFATNRGSGGDFPTIGGTLVTGSYSPTD